MNATIFYKMAYEIFDAIYYNSTERLYVMQEYYDLCVAPLRDTLSAEELIECVNCMGRLVSDNYSNKFRKAEIIAFMTQMNDAPVLGPYFPGMLYSILEEAEETRKTFGTLKRAIPEDNQHFTEVKKIDKERLFKEVNEILQVTGLDKRGVHDVLEQWLSSRVITAFKQKKLPKELIDSVIEVAESVEKFYKPADSGIDNSDYLKIMYSFSKFSDVDFTKPADFIPIIAGKITAPLRGGTAVTYKGVGGMKRGVVVGRDDRLGVYLIQTEGLKNNYTVQTVKCELVQ